MMEQKIFCVKSFNEIKFFKIVQDIEGDQFQHISKQESDFQVDEELSFMALVMIIRQQVPHSLSL